MLKTLKPAFLVDVLRLHSCRNRISKRSCHTLLLHQESQRSLQRRGPGLARTPPSTPFIYNVQSHHLNHKWQQQSRSFTYTWTTGSHAIAANAAPLASDGLPNISLDLLPLVLAAVLAASSSSNDAEDENENRQRDSVWTVKDLSRDGKGFVAVAARSLELGEHLISERPICIWPQGLSSRQAKDLFDAMPDKDQRTFMELAVSEGEGLPGGIRSDGILARRATNGFAVQLPGQQDPNSGKTVAMVFPRIARINHSCVPNASQAMNFQTLRMEVYSITAIATGTEINIEYLPNLITQTYSERQKSLLDAFGFSSCLCHVCTNSKEEIHNSDTRRLEIKNLMSNLKSGRKDRKATLEKMERVRQLLAEEGYVGLPEFEDPSISNAYAVYASMHARSTKANNSI